MAKLVYGLNQSLDGYVDHDYEGFVPGPTLFRHFTEELSRQAGALYGRKMYQLMNYWDGNEPEWSDAERQYAEAWQNAPKWVVSRSLTSVGPNATLLGGDLRKAVQSLKDDHDGEIEVAGPDLAGSLTRLGLIDEYRIYLHPIVMGKGTRFFAGSPPPLRLEGSENMGDNVIRLSYVPV